MTDAQRQRSVVMLGTFGLRPKATLRSRALAIAQALAPRCGVTLITTPWDNPSDGGRRWNQHGVPVVNTRVTRPALFPLAVRQMLRESRSIDPDLVHLFKPKGFGDLAARRLRRRLPVVVDMDDWEGNGGWNEIGGYGRVQRMVFDWQERTWPRLAAAITVASRELERRAQALGARPNSIFYVPNGLTRAHFDELSQPSTEDDSASATVLLYTRFVEFDVSFVVQVMSRVRQEVPDARLLVVGASVDGRAEERLCDEAQQAGISGAVEMRGWVEPHAIPSLLKGAQVAIHPFDDTPVNRAKCSVKLLELMAAGRAVVTSTVGENAQMVEASDSGLLVPPGDAPGMAQRVITLLGDRARATQLGEAARERVRQGFLWDELASRAIDAYDYALSQKNRNSA